MNTERTVLGVCNSLYLVFKGLIVILRPYRKGMRTIFPPHLNGHYDLITKHWPFQTT